MNYVGNKRTCRPTLIKIIEVGSTLKTRTRLKATSRPTYRVAEKGRHVGRPPSLTTDPLSPFIRVWATVNKNCLWQRNPNQKGCMIVSTSVVTIIGLWRRAVAMLAGHHLRQPIHCLPLSLSGRP